jgi:hypothetical protein
MTSSQTVTGGEIFAGGVIKRGSMSFDEKQKRGSA